MTKKQRNNKKFRSMTGSKVESFTPGRGSVITFGEPEPILTTGTDYHNIWYDNEYDHWRLPIIAWRWPSCRTLTASTVGYCMRGAIWLPVATSAAA